VGLAEELLGPIADDKSWSHKFGVLVGVLLIYFIWFPLFFVLFVVYVPFFCFDICFQAATGNLLIIKFMVMFPSSYLMNVITMVGYPVNSMSMIRHSGTLRKQAHTLTANQATSIYLIPKKLFMTWTSFPVYEDVKDQLKQKKIKDLFTTGAMGAAETLFVSHKWLGNKPDTSENEIFNMVKKFVRTLVGKSTRFVWFDFTCVPQSPEAKAERNQQLFAIANLMKKCNVRAFNVDETHKQEYQKSVWCRLEMMATYQLSNITMSLDDMTMFDQNDLYAVLPAFIEMVFSRRYRLEFVVDDDRLKIFVSILRYFIKYHDATPV
jgi:hypothetical protein